MLEDRSNGRILLLNTLYVPNVGGVENSIRELAREFSSRGAEVVVVCSNRSYVDSSTLESVEEREFETVHRYDYPVGARGYVSQYRNCSRLIRKLNDERPFTLVISRSHITTIAARAAGLGAVLYVIPSVTAVRDWPRSTGEYGFRSLAKYAADVTLQFVGLQGAAKRFAFSAQTARHARSAALLRGVSDISVTRPGVNVERFATSIAERERCKTGIRSRHNLPVGVDKLAVAVGRYSREKRFDLAIRATTFLPERYHLLLIGDGPCREDYEALISDLDIDDRVTLCPATDRPEAYYAAGDVFVMSSFYEAFGQTLLEATASGLPVAAFGSSDVKTAVADIYRKFPALVRFARRACAKDLAQAIIDAAAAKGGLYTEQREAFLAEHSWARLADELSAHAL